MILRDYHTERNTYNTLRLLHWTGVLVTVLIVFYIELARRSGVSVPVPFLLLYASVVLAANMGGLRPGLLSAAVAGAFIIHASVVSFGPLTLTGGLLQVALGNLLIFITAYFLGRTKTRNIAMIQEILEHQRSLEKLVDDRTSELIETNKVLRLEITERKQTEEALRENKEHLTDLIEGAPDSIITLDKHGYVLSINPATLRFTGYRSDEIVGKRFSKLEIFTPSSKSRALEEFGYALAGKHRSPFELEIIHKDGTHYYLEANLQLIQRDGKADEVEIIIRDITERKLVSEKLEKSHKILLQTNKELIKVHEQEAALRDQLVKAERLVSIGEMAAKIAHEINNPLTVIMGQAQLQLMSIEDDEVKKGLDLIFKNAEEVSQLTRRYMDLGKPVDTKLEPIILGEVLKNTVISLSALGQLKKIKLSEQYLDKERKVLGNQHMMEQVFRNLIINAIQASDESKDAEILLGTRVGKEGKVVEAYVSDKGVGIKAEEVEKIFDYYYTTKGEGTGTGLGLVICKEIVETTHGGRIDVLSSQGAGATFTVELPTLEYSLQKKKIMIVDDEAYITELFGTYLSRMGFLIQSCNRGEEALRIYPDFMPDLVLSDYDMPEMTGLELYKKIKEIKDDQPFVMITGAFLSPEDLKYLREQKIPQLIKPANLETELLETVKQQLESD